MKTYLLSLDDFNELCTRIAVIVRKNFGTPSFCTLYSSQCSSLDHIILHFHFLITYEVCKKRKYCNHMSEKTFSPFDECSFFLCLRRQNK